MDCVACRRPFKETISAVCPHCGKDHSGLLQSSRVREGRPAAPPSSHPRPAASDEYTPPPSGKRPAASAKPGPQGRPVKPLPAALDEYVPPPAPHSAQPPAAKQGSPPPERPEPSHRTPPTHAPAPEPESTPPPAPWRRRATPIRTPRPQPAARDAYVPPPPARKPQTPPPPPAPTAEPPEPVSLTAGPAPPEELEPDVEDLLHAAWEARRGREFDKLLRLVERILKFAPHNLEAQYLLGLAEFELGRYRNALHIWREAKRKHPEEPHLNDWIHRAEQALAGVLTAKAHAAHEPPDVRLHPPDTPAPADEEPAEEHHARPHVPLTPQLAIHCIVATLFGMVFLCLVGALVGIPGGYGWRLWVVTAITLGLAAGSYFEFARTTVRLIERGVLGRALRALVVIAAGYAAGLYSQYWFAAALAPGGALDTSGQVVRLLPSRVLGGGQDVSDDGEIGETDTRQPVATDAAAGNAPVHAPVAATFGEYLATLQQEPVRFYGLFTLSPGWFWYLAVLEVLFAVAISLNVREAQPGRRRQANPLFA